MWTGGVAAAAGGAVDALVADEDVDETPAPPEGSALSAPDGAQAVANTSTQPKRRPPHRTIPSMLARRDGTVEDPPDLRS